MLLVEARDGVPRRQRSEVFRDLHQARRVGLERLDELGMGAVERGRDDAGDEFPPLGSVGAAVGGAEEDLDQYQRLGYKKEAKRRSLCP